ncbi:hypothetical protein AAEP93_010551 [Penicillium crustosum]
MFSVPLARSEAELFATDWFPETKRRRLINILLGDDGPFAHTSKGPSFYFNGRSLHRPEYTAFHRSKVPIDHINDRLPSLLGYVHYTKVN